MGVIVLWDFQLSTGYYEYNNTSVFLSERILFFANREFSVLVCSSDSSRIVFASVKEKEPGHTVKCSTLDILTRSETPVWVNSIYGINLIFLTVFYTVTG